MLNKTLIISHSTGIFGPSDFLYNFLSELNAETYKLIFPLKDFNSEVSLSKLKTKEIYSLKKKGSLFSLVYDFFLTIIIIIKIKP